MIEKKVEKVKSDRDDGVELENQFILRLPQEVAAAVHEALESANLKDRMTIQMDNDLRYGEVRFDQWLLHAKILDLPTIIESLKTIDNKSFYKSADICQIMICKEEMDPVESEKESPNKGKKKDPNKVDKKYLWPHGITPPCKNVRKRRFRKTLKKKNVEAPEIEKEVKQLLRLDNDAVKVEYEIVNEDTYKRSSDVNSKYNDGDDEYNDDTQHEADKTNDSSSQKDVNIESDIEDDDAATRRMAISGVGEHDIFGGEVSSSDSDNDDDRPDTSNMMEDMSRMSADDSRMSDFSMGGGGGGRSINNTINNGLAGSSSDMNTSKEEPTEFNKSMFGSPKASTSNHMRSKFDGSSSNLAAPSGYFDEQKQRGDYDDESTTDNTPQMNPEEANAKILELRRQYNELKATHDQKAQEINNIQNATLRQRLQDNLDNLQGQMVEKELEIKDLEGMV